MHSIEYSSLIYWHMCLWSAGSLQQQCRHLMRAAIKFQPYNKRIPVTDLIEQTRVWDDLNLLTVFVPWPFDVRPAARSKGDGRGLSQCSDSARWRSWGIVLSQRGGARVRTRWSESQFSEHAASSTCIRWSCAEKSFSGRRRTKQLNAVNSCNNFAEWLTDIKTTEHLSPVHISNIFEAAFDIVERIIRLVAFDDVAWTLLLVWTGL